MERPDIKDMAAFVAAAIFAAAAGDDADFAEVTEDERNQFLVIAHRAIAAHHAFLEKAGFRVLPSGAVAVPSCKEEAAAMVLAVKKYREGERIIKPKLILPNSALN